MLLWPVPEGEAPDPNLDIPVEPLPMSQIVLPAFQSKPVVAVEADAPEDQAAAALTSFGSSEYAKVILGALWGKPPALDLEAEADLHELLAALAEKELIRSARDISDGGIAVSVAQAAFAKSIGATVEQDQSLMAHPLFGLFAEVASTVLVTTDPSNCAAIERLAAKYNFFAARVGTTGGRHIKISVDGQTFISSRLDELRKPWAASLEATLHDEVTV